MGIIDIIVVLIFLFGLYLGYQRGFIKQISDFIILFVSSFLAGRISDFLFGILCEFLPFFNFVGKSEGIKSINIILWKLILYLLSAVLLIYIIRTILIKLKLIDKIMDSIVESNLLSRILGVMISIPLMLIFTFDIFLILLSPNFNITGINNSKLVSFVMEKTPVLSKENNNLYDNQKYAIKRINKKDNTSENYVNVNDNIIGKIINTNLVKKEKINKLKSKGKLLGKRKQKEDNKSDSKINNEENNNENNEENNNSESNFSTDNIQEEDDASNDESIEEGDYFEGEEAGFEDEEYEDEKLENEEPEDDNFEGEEIEFDDNGLEN